MKKLLLFISFLFCCSSIIAQKLENGFYRVYNKGENRYIYVTDNTGSATDTKQDLRAVQLISGISKTISDPGSIVYVTKISDGKYDLKSQGTSVYKIIGHYPEIRWASLINSYRIGATVNGAQLWLGSDNDPGDVKGELTVKNISNKDKMGWVFVPVSSEGDNYFGITPSIEVNGKYYHTLFVEFAYALVSQGLKAYYIDKAEGSIARLVELEDGIVPAKTPVIIECSSENPSDNRIELFVDKGNSLKNNLLKGNYFCNIYRPKTAVLKYDKTSMRVLGKTPDGKLGFVVSGEENIRANSAYFPVDATAEDVIYLMDETNYASIDNHMIDEPSVYGVYSILGVKLRDDSNLDGFSAGIYIVNGKKIIKR